MTRIIRIATRESKLALWQAHFVRDSLLAAHADVEVEIMGMTTEGDRNKVSPLSQIGGKGVFVKELEQSLLRGASDIAVHSMKDVPSVLPDGLSINGICQRADPRDAFVSNQYATLADVPAGGRIGSSSLRRRLQLKARYPDLEYIELRGNVGTRLRKLDEGKFDGIILASAGLTRLGLADRITEAIDTSDCIPSAGQGAVGIESRTSDTALNRLLQAISDEPTELCVSCERLITLSLGATCNLPIAAFAQRLPTGVQMSAFVSNNDGSQTLHETLIAPEVEAKNMARQIAQNLLAAGARELIENAGS